MCTSILWPCSKLVCEPSCLLSPRCKCHIWTEQYASLQFGTAHMGAVHSSQTCVSTSNCTITWWAGSLSVLATWVAWQRKDFMPQLERGLLQGSADSFDQSADCSVSRPSLWYSLALVYTPSDTSARLGWYHLLSRDTKNAKNREKTPKTRNLLHQTKLNCAARWKQS